MTEIEGNAELSERELEVLRLVATGASNRQIARRLHISHNTVKVHLRNIFAKLGVESRTEATLRAINEGWVEVTTPPTEMPAEPIVVRRIAGWQRVAFVLLALVLAVIVLLPPRGSESLVPDRQFSDQGWQAGVVTTPGPVSRWSERTPMSIPRARLAVVAYRDQIYAIGGDTPTGATGAVEVYDPETDSWTRRADKPTPVLNIAAAVIGDRIYVPGGYDAAQQPVAALEIYDPLQDAWSQGAPLPEPLFAAAVAAEGGRLYVFGGHNGMQYVNTVYIYDPEADTWSLGTPMSTARGFASAVEFDGLIYVVGGYNGATEFDLCEVYDPAAEAAGSNPWSSRAPMAQGRGGLALAAADGSLYAIGGGWINRLSFNERYDVAQDTWSPFETPVLEQWRTLGAATIQTGDGPVIYAVGGFSGDYLNTNRVFQTFFRIYLPRL